MNENYIVKIISAKVAKEYIRTNHYSHGCHNGPSPCFGLYEQEQLIGVLMFATPCSENVRSSVFGKEHKDSVTELHRLHILDITPKNTESWFISKCLKMLKEVKPHIKAVISFSDSTEGHTGVIYRATNAMYLGQTGKATFYVDVDGRLRHPRQSGVNISLEEAEKRNWKPVKRMSKNRFLWLLPKSKVEKKYLTKLLKLQDSTKES
jgi:hypothetical protein